MGKHETPPFRMKIEGGKLVPATAYDAERLDTYRRGTPVRVQITEERDRPMIRKWWAILGLVVKQCDVPWSNKEQASEAIKLALGLVHYTKTVTGKFMAYPKSLTELTDPDLDEAVEQMVALIQRMTGIDPETLKKEMADIGDDEQEPAPASPSGAAGSAADPAPQGSAPDQSAAADPEGDAGDPPAPVSPSVTPYTLQLMAECRDKMLGVASDPDVPEAKERRGILERTKDAWKAELKDHLPFVKACFEAADRVIKGGKEADERKYLDGLITRASGGAS